jgi:hypothetical protein
VFRWTVYHILPAVTGAPAPCDLCGATGFVRKWQGIFHCMQIFHMICGI